MYSWGASTEDWAKPGAYSFDDARKSAMDRDAKKAADRGGRTYLSRKAPDLDLVDPRGKTIVSRSANPVVVAVDVTGSMAHWPAEIFDRLPLLYQTLSQYRPDLEVSFAAIGDATSDRYPLQVADFGAGADLDQKLGALYGEGGGGGGARESYELFAYFLTHRALTPNAARPFLILYGDEGFYPEVNAKQVEHYLGGQVTGERSSVAIFRALAQRFEVYLLRKTYGSPAEDRRIVAQWQKVLEPERILPVPDEQRAVDLALGLIARSWDRFEDFQENMAARQPVAKVKELANSLDARSRRGSRGA
jgi:hypothetical protein